MKMNQMTEPNNNENETIISLPDKSKLIDEFITNELTEYTNYVSSLRLSNITYSALSTPQFITHTPRFTNATPLNIVSPNSISIPISDTNLIFNIESISNPTNKSRIKTDFDFQISKTIFNLINHFKDKSNLSLKLSKYTTSVATFKSLSQPAIKKVLSQTDEILLTQIIRPILKQSFRIKSKEPHTVLIPEITKDKITVKGISNLFQHSFHLIDYETLFKFYGLSDDDNSYPNSNTILINRYNSVLFALMFTEYYLRLKCQMMRSALFDILA